MKHTPGPWIVGGPIKIDSAYIYAGQGSSKRIVAQNVLAKNASLIAAAPDCLIELQDLVYLLKTYIQPLHTPDSVLGIEIQARIDCANQVIAKAEGREPNDDILNEVMTDEIKWGVD